MIALLSANESISPFYPRSKDDGTPGITERSLPLCTQSFENSVLSIGKSGRTCKNHPFIGARRLERLQTLPRLRGPTFDGFILSSAEQDSLIWRTLQRPHPALMPTQRCNAFTCRQVPDFDGLIGTAAIEGVIIRIKH